MSPHRGGGMGTVEIERERMDTLVKALMTAARDGPQHMPNRFDLQRGY